MSHYVAGTALTSDRARLTERIVDAVRQECARRWSSELRALILTGSMARGEGTFRRSGCGYSVRGDAEFMLVFQERARLPRAGELEAARNAAEERLRAEGLACPLDFSAVKPGYFASLEPHMFAYELRNCGRTVWGDGNVLASIPDFPADQIPREDAFRTLCNRMVEEAGSLAASEAADNLPEPVRQATVKLYLDMCSSLLLFLGAYAPGYAARLAKLRELSAGWPLPFPADDFIARVDECTAWKLSEGAPEIANGGDLLRSALAHAHLLWRWELKCLTGAEAGASDAELWSAWVRRQSGRVRGWLYALRKRGWHRSWRLWPHWARLLAGGAPRIWVYGVAAELLFATPELMRGTRWERARAAGARLPVPAHSEEWRELAAAVGRNYQEFLVSTRS